jgi:hypothetical protein
MTTTDVLDKRLTDFETIVCDIPVLLTTRTAKYEAESTSISGRLDKIERNQGMLQVNMRDLRNGVARFMVEFAERMRTLEDVDKKDRADNETARADDKTRFDAVNATLARINAALDGHIRGLEVVRERDRADNKTRFDAVDATLVEILKRLPKV